MAGSLGGAKTSESERNLKRKEKKKPRKCEFIVNIVESVREPSVLISQDPAASAFLYCTTQISDIWSVILRITNIKERVFTQFSVNIMFNRRKFLARE